MNPNSGKPTDGRVSNKPISHNARFKNYNSLGPRLKKTFQGKVKEEIMNEKAVSILPAPALGKSLGHGIMAKKGRRDLSKRRQIL